jgi:hypothetical protein
MKSGSLQTSLPRTDDLCKDPCQEVIEDPAGKGVRILVNQWGSLYRTGGPSKNPCLLDNYNWFWYWLILIYGIKNSCNVPCKELRIVARILEKNWRSSRRSEDLFKEVRILAKLGSLQWSEDHCEDPCMVNWYCKYHCKHK